ncbi:hypothetical protein GXM_01423 [Nostoc sphaeroides CCNUC1]|uniref:Uncharacterized protein n=1 Tax=Nostoc sphaeroides CCNUC1 TaxID=2653204 RepID=A0A5P8VU92_9NOSO|nr:hypothetical protein GXM_01423 [Nostoc sphaeroides CCNUC1]
MGEKPALLAVSVGVCHTNGIPLSAIASKNPLGTCFLTNS